MRRNFLRFGASCLGSYLVTPSYIFNEYNLQKIKTLKSQIKDPSSCLTQLIAMHTGFSEIDISQSDFSCSSKQITCSLDIPERLLQRVFAQQVRDGKLTYLHINSSQKFWGLQENRKLFLNLLSSPLSSQALKTAFPQIKISFSADNIKHRLLAKKIATQLNKARVICSENPLAPLKFLSTWKTLDFPIVDWQAVGLEPQLLAQLMFDEHSNWSLHNAKQLLEKSDTDNPRELYDLALKLC